MAKVLIICAHPDDETLGMGGTILKHVAAGDAVHWLVVTAAKAPAYKPALVKAKAAEIRAVARHYGFASHRQAGLPTTTLADLPLGQVIDAVRPDLARIRPDTVYTVHPGDVHSDHRAVFDAVWTCGKTFRAMGDGPRRVLCFETASSTDAAPPLAERAFLANAFSDIGAHLDGKLAAMALYASELQPDPLPRSLASLRALAQVRGGQCGCAAAEAFHLLRDCW